MNIFIDIRLLGHGTQSGIEEYTTQVVDHLLRAGKADRFTLFYNGLHKRPLPAHWLTYPNVSVISWNIPNRLLDIFTRLVRWPDIPARAGAHIVFSPHFTMLVTRIPHVITFHDLSFIRYPQFFGLRQRLWHWMQNYRAQARSAAAIVVDSSFSGNDVENILNIPRERIHCIYPGVNEIFKPLPAHSTTLAEFKENHKITFPYLLAVGTIEPRKNIPLVVRAFTVLKRNPHYKDLRLIIAGAPGWLYKTTEKTIQESPARTHIIRWGKIRPEDRRLLYTGASAFAYPSFFEGFGFPPVEAQACGCPVVVSNRTSLPEVVGESALRVNPWSVDELAQALQSILTNPVVREKLMTTGYENVKRFNWKTTAAQLLTLLHEIATKKNI